MKNLKKILNCNLIIIIVFTVFTFALNFGFCGEQVFAADNPAQAPTQQIQKTTPIMQSSTADVSAQAKNSLNRVKNFPVEQRGLKFGMIKFLTGMLGVLISAFAIFLGLKVYKKFVIKNNTKQEIIDYDNTLESPKDFKEAINIFLDKTDKK